MSKTKNKAIRLIAAMLAAIVALCAGISAAAETKYLPDVSDEMTRAEYWAEKAEQPDAVMAGADEIAALNAAFLECPDCTMTDLTRFYPSYDGEALKRSLLKLAMKDLSDYLDAGYFNTDEQPVPYADMAAIFESIDGAETIPTQRVRYGICVTLANVRAVPTDMIITDAPGEPVLVKAQNADGSWYYCDSICVSGWVPASDIAICKDRREWLEAWRIPDGEAVVVTEGKIYLDASNVNAATSQRMLTMGTVLRRVSDDDFDAAVTNRAVYQNHAVYLPVRDANGNYAVTMALIPQHCAVSEGYLPLTARNVLEVAFTMLGDAYGWGGMLTVPDCSLYIRNIYKCFGLEIPRNTTWQAAMPVTKYDLSEMDAEAKAALLGALPVGTILFFRGHEMLYLGEAMGKHYVINTVSSIMTPDGASRVRVRSVVINALESTKRANGNTWLEDLNLAAVPFLPAVEELAEAG